MICGIKYLEFNLIILYIIYITNFDYFVKSRFYFSHEVHEESQRNTKKDEKLIKIYIYKNSENNEQSALICVEFFKKSIQDCHCEEQSDGLSLPKAKQSPYSRSQT